MKSNIFGLFKLFILLNMLVLLLFTIPERTSTLDKLSTEKQTTGDIADAVDNSKIKSASKFFVTASEEQPDKKTGSSVKVNKYNVFHYPRQQGRDAEQTSPP